MEIYSIQPNSWRSNCYILINEDENGRHGAVVDPSVPANEIISFVSGKDARLEMIILTHGHFDHVLSVDTLREQLNIPLYIHEKDAELLLDGEKNAYTLFFGKDMVYKPADRLLCDDGIVNLGSEQIKIFSTPGHTPGSICLLCPDFILTGDTLFADGYGRYDLYGGCREQLKDSLGSLRSLNRELTIYPGHGREELLGNALDNIHYL